MGDILAFSILVFRYMNSTQFLDQGCKNREVISGEVGKANRHIERYSIKMQCRRKTSLDSDLRGQCLLIRRERVAIYGGVGCVR